MFETFYKHLCTSKIGENWRLQFTPLLREDDKYWHLYIYTG